MSQLRAFVERIERLQEEKRSIEGDIKEIYAEIAANGYDKKVVREVVKRRGKDQSELSEFETVLQLYEDEITRGTTNVSHARDAREGQSRVIDLPAAIVPRDAAAISAYTPTPVPAVVEIDLAIPAFLRKGTPENAAIGGAS